MKNLNIKIVIMYFKVGKTKDLMDYINRFPKQDIKIEFDSNIHSILKYLIKIDNSELLSLLCKFSNIDIDKYFEEFFLKCCEDGSICSARWLRKKKVIIPYILLKDSFIKACYNNRTQVAIWLIRNNDINLIIHKNNDSIFRKCCKLNNYDIVMLLLAHFKFNLVIDKQFHDEYNSESPFHFFCRYNYLELAKRYSKLDNFDIHDKDDEAIALACQENHLEMAKFLYSLGANIRVKNDWCVMISINRNNIEILKWIQSLNIIDFNANNNYILRVCCNNGKLDIIKWLHSLGQIDMNILSDIMFTNSCIGGNLETCKWIYSFGKIELSQFTFNFLCQLGNLDILKWIYDTVEIDIHYDNELAFITSCEYGKFDVAQWIYSLGNVKIEANGNQAFLTACHNNHIDIVHWLKSLKPDKYIITIENNILTSFKVLRVVNINGYKTIDQIKMCPICYESNSEILTECNHQYCKDCFLKYINRQPYDFEDISCPYCRHTNMKLFFIKKKN